MTRGSSQIVIRRAVLLIAAAAALPSLTTAVNAATYTGATGGQWGTAANWTGGVPNATDAVADINAALTVNVSDTGTAGAYPYTFGTLGTTITTGSVVVGDAGVTTDQLTMAVNTGSPTISVASGGTIFMYATLGGSQGFTKTGAGKLTFRFNSAAQAYSGAINVSAGVLGIQQEGSLGASTNGITIGNGARLLAEPSPSGSITLPSTRTITLAGVQSQLGASAAGDTLVVNGAINESAAGNGLVKTDNGRVTLNGTLSYTGETRIAGGTLGLGGSALLPSGQNLRFNQNAASTLDVGSTSQTVRTIVMDVTTANRTITGAGGSLTVNGDANLQFSANNGIAYSMAGLDNFTFNRSNRQFNFQTVNVDTVTTIADLNLAKLTNTITASQFLVGGGNSAGNNGNTARAHLGTTNVVNAVLFQLGGFNAGGIVDFQSGLTNPSLKLRGADGTSAMGTLRIGETSSGTRRGEGFLNLTGGSIDAVVTTVQIGRHVANSTNADTSSITVPAGILTADSLTMAEKTGTGTPTLTSTFNQGGGTVSVGTITMGTDAGSGATPTLIPTYNLTGGTLRATSIAAGGGGFAAASNRTLSVNGGTLRNRASTDLVVNGFNGTTGGRLNVVVGSSGATFEADAGQSITVSAFAPITGTGALTKAGPGTLYLNNTTTVGSLLVDAGTLGGTGTVASAGGITVDVDGAIAPGNSIGTLTVTGNLTINGAYAAEVAVGPAADLIAVSGTLDLGAASSLVLSGAVSPSETYVLATYGAMTTGDAFASISNPFAATHAIVYGTQGGLPGQITLAPIPEPGTALVSIGGMLLVSLRRRR